MRSSNQPYSLVEPDYADFEGVLSDHQLRERYKSEFDPWWIEKRGVEGKFELFDKKYTSRLKQEDLFKHGVFKDQDTFYIETTAQNGAKIMRGVRADGFKGDKGRDAYTPNIELPAQEPTDPPARHEPCVGPKEIIKAITGHYNEIRRPYNVWKEIIVFRNDQLIIGTMHEARQRFAFWQLVVDRYTDRNGLPGRRRRIMDPITRAHTGMPALTVNLNWYPPNPRDRIVQQ
ncbi:MAG: hypothetical protein LQ343_007206 [Gyalolechia ehrenbergii]|nr:MAG: hypothetical protein LQ343_007206 [Gyalolechia ehrenbergii]